MRRFSIAAVALPLVLPGAVAPASFSTPKNCGMRHPAAMIQVFMPGSQNRHTQRDGALNLHGPSGRRVPVMTP